MAVHRHNALQLRQCSADRSRAQTAVRAGNPIHPADANAAAKPPPDIYVNSFKRRCICFRYKCFPTLQFLSSPIRPSVLSEADRHLMNLQIQSCVQYALLQAYGIPGDNVSYCYLCVHFCSLRFFIDINFVLYHSIYLLVAGALQIHDDHNDDIRNMEDENDN